MPIFRRFSRLVEAIEAVGISLERLAKAQEDVAPAIVRLDALELSRHQFEAMMEGLFLKAEGKLKAASNAEARERQLKKSYERNLDPLDPDGEEGPEPAAVLQLNAASSEEERLSAMRLDVAPNHKTRALMYKFGH